MASILLLLGENQPLRAEPADNCLPSFAALAHLPDEVQTLITRLGSEIDTFPWGVRHYLRREWSSAQKAISQEGPDWMQAERIRQIRNLEKKITLLKKWEIERLPADENWLTDQKLRLGLLPYLESRGLTFNPEEKNRFRRILLKITESRALRFILNPGSIPPRDFDQIPPLLFAKIISEGIEPNRIALEQALTNSPRRFLAYENAIRQSYRVGFLLLSIKLGWDSYQKITKEQQEKQKKNFFDKLKSIEKSLNALDETLDTDTPPLK